MTSVPIDHIAQRIDDVIFGMTKDVEKDALIRTLHAIANDVRTWRKNVPPTERDYYAELEPDEPFFLIMGRDSDGYQRTMTWAMERRHQIKLGSRPNTPEERDQIAAAIRRGTEMERYWEAKRTRDLAARMTFNQEGFAESLDGVPIEKGKKGS